MKKESLEDELKLLKMDYQTLQKNTREEINGLHIIVKDMREHIAYIYGKLEIRIPQRKHCMECDGVGRVSISPMNDCGETNSCKNCNGFGFRYL